MVLWYLESSILIAEKLSYCSITNVLGSRATWSDLVTWHEMTWVQNFQGGWKWWLIRYAKTAALRAAVFRYPRKTAGGMGDQTSPSRVRHTNLKRPKMWPICEIRHVSKHEFLFLSVFFSKNEVIPGRSAFCLTPVNIVCTLLQSPMFVSAPPSRICRFK